MSLTLVVLAAGMGSRYGGLKQIDPVGPSGESIIDYSIYDAARAGFGKVVFIIRHDIEKEFRLKIGDRYKSLIQVEYAFQETSKIPDCFTLPAERTKPWGTGHAVLMAEDLVKDNFAVINADDFYGKRSFQLLADNLRQSNTLEADFSMIGFTLRNTLSEFGSVSRGVCEKDSSGNLKDVRELTKIEPFENGARYLKDSGEYEKLSGNEIVSLNMWGFTPLLFKYLETMFRDFLKENLSNLKSEFYIPFAVDSLIKEAKAKVKIIETPDKWFGVTYKEDREDVMNKIDSFIKAGLYPSPLWMR